MESNNKRVDPPSPAFVNGDLSTVLPTVGKRHMPHVINVEFNQASFPFEMSSQPSTMSLDIDDESHAGGRWSVEEDNQLRATVSDFGPKNWKRISQMAFQGSRTDVQCLHRWQKVLKPGLIKGSWTKREDGIVLEMVNKYGLGNIKWSVIAHQLTGRLGKQCRERWFNHLDPDLKKESWSLEEDNVLMEAQATMGNRWCQIAQLLPGRSENAVKNRWNSAMRRKFQMNKEDDDFVRDKKKNDIKKDRKKNSGLVFGQTNIFKKSGDSRDLFSSEFEISPITGKPKRKYTKKKQQNMIAFDSFSGMNPSSAEAFWPELADSAPSFSRNRPQAIRNTEMLLSGNNDYYSQKSYAQDDTNNLLDDLNFMNMDYRKMGGILKLDLEDSTAQSNILDQICDDLFPLDMMKSF